MPLWRIYYHVVWTTKDRLPMISAELERPLLEYIVGKATALDVIVQAIGGIEDHIHLIVSVPPKSAVAEIVGQLKGASSHWVGERYRPSEAFVWQRGYGVFSLGSRQLEEAIAYVHRQREHHRDRSTIPWLERVSDDDEGPVSPRGAFRPDGDSAPTKRQ